MKRLWIAGLVVVGVCYALPVVGGTTSGTSPRQEASMWEGQASDVTIAVQVDGQVRTMALEDYVEGVTAAEIPDSFPVEALRAQAVAARTYALYKKARTRGDAHPEADVCDDYTHCAAYRDRAVATAQGEIPTAIAQAVRDTAGQVICYEGAPIAAVFHCASGPRTEAAREVWGEDVPYLQSVVSPGGTACPNYEDTVTLPLDTFAERVREAIPGVDLSEQPSKWFRASVRTAGGAVQTVELGGIRVKGSALRTLLGLRSAAFTVQTDETEISFHTIGYGHGVGLSQYGARYMALRGEGYAEILAHYYPNTTLEVWGQSEDNATS